ncbi:UPF0149 family protein [Neisseriaceae bacterium CLB008]|nr:YecA family protein [Neisseriaceae bacterium]
MTTMTFGAAEQKALETLLNPQAIAGDCMRVDEVQAFFTALVSGPDPVVVADWLTEITGDDAGFDAEEEAQIVALVDAMVADLKTTLAARQPVSLILYPDAEAVDGLDYLSWSNAYLCALDVTQTDWFEAIEAEEFEDLLTPIMALAGMFDEQPGQAALLTFTEREIKVFQQQLPEIVGMVYGYWQHFMNPVKTVRREGDKVGRNDPCPCGSGKKFKACCKQSQD